MKKVSITLKLGAVCALILYSGCAIAALSDAQLNQLLNKKKMNQSDIALLRSEISRIESKYKNAKIDADYITANTENIRTDYLRLARINKGMSAKGAGSQDASRVYDGVTATFKKTKSPDLITIMAQVNDSLRKQPQDSPMFREEPSGSSKPAPSPTVTLIDTTPLPPTPSETTMPYSKVSDFDIDFKEGDSIIPAPPAPPAVGSSKPSTTLSKTPLEVHNDSLSEVRNARQSSHLLQINDDGKKARRALLQAYEHYKPIDSKTSVLLPFTTEDRIKIFREEIMAQDYREIHGLTNEEAWRRAREDIRDSKKIAALDQKYQLNELYKDVLGIPLPASSPAPTSSTVPAPGLTLDQKIAIEGSEKAVVEAAKSPNLLAETDEGKSARTALVNAFRDVKHVRDASKGLESKYSLEDIINAEMPRRLFYIIYMNSNPREYVKANAFALNQIKDTVAIEELNKKYALSDIYKNVFGNAYKPAATSSSPAPSAPPASSPSAPPVESLTHSQMILGVEKAKELDDSKEALEKALNSKDLLIKSAIGVSARGDLINALKGHKITSNATGNDIKNAYKTVDEIGEQFLLIFLKKKYTAELDDEIKGARKAAVLIKEQKEIDKLNTEFDLQALFQSVLSEVPARLRISTLSSTTPVSKAPAPVPTTSAPDSTKENIKNFANDEKARKEYLEAMKGDSTKSTDDVLKAYLEIIGTSVTLSLGDKDSETYLKYVSSPDHTAKPTEEQKKLIAQVRKATAEAQMLAYYTFAEVYFPALTTKEYAKPDDVKNAVAILKGEDLSFEQIEGIMKSINQKQNGSKEIFDHSWMLNYVISAWKELQKTK